MFTCYIVWAILRLITSLGYYFSFASYHLTGITYESMAIHKNKYDKYAYLNQKASDKWTDTSLRNLQEDMLNQHTVVRRDLQERHLSMEVNINTYTKCATNHILYETTEAIATAHGPGVTNGTPPPSPNCIDVLNLSSSRRRLAEGDEDEGVNVVTLTLPEGYGGVRGELYDIETKEDGFILTMNNMMNTVNSIAKKLDMDVVEPKKNKPKTPKKPKHAKQSEAQGEEGAQEDEDALFKRNLLAIEGVKDMFDKMESQVKSVESKVESVATKDDVKDVKSKFESTESKVESIEGKVESMEGRVESIEGKVESIEGKVESMEKTMEELKEMLSQLLAKGGVVG